VAFLITGDEDPVALPPFWAIAVVTLAHLRTSQCSPLGRALADCLSLSWHPSSGLGAPFLKLCFHGAGGGSRKKTWKSDI
jgi:hypothetical protein